MECRAIPGFDGKYLACENGDIIRVPRPYSREWKGRTIITMLPEKILSGSKLDTKGYKRVTLEGKQYFVHRLIAIAFFGINDLKPQVNHKNGIKIDNRISNLEWVTNQQNRDHAVATGLQVHGTRVLNSKLKDSDISKIINLYNNGYSQIVISRMYNIRQQTVSKIVQRKLWKHVKV